MDNVIFASYGNDSVALIRWAYEGGLRGVVVAYSDTGWAAPWWEDRVLRGEAWCRELGFEPVRLKSEGMESLIRRKKAWPRGGGGKFQFCTQELKIKPALSWLDGRDPEKEATCLIGIRREESAGRATFPEHTDESKNHGGRDLWAPLVRHTEAMRDELIGKTPMPVLPVRSKECWPCVNARKADLRHMDDRTMVRVMLLEEELGTNSKGNPRVMFSPLRHSGAVGIFSVVEEARSRAKDEPQATGCDGGWCGM